MKSGLSSGLAGVAGEYFVAAELSRHGFIASITLRNSKGIDILAASEDASFTVGIQVKTNNLGSTSWILNEKCEQLKDPGIFYVFVKLNKIGEIPDFFILPSTTVAEIVHNTHLAWLKTPRKDGLAHNKTSMRKLFLSADSEYRNNWDLLWKK